IRLDSAPGRMERDWMRAVGHSGTRVQWNGNLPAIAIAAQPVASPRGGIRALAAAPNSNRVSIEDNLGLIEGANAHAGGASFDIPVASGNLVAAVGVTKATADPVDSIRIGRVLVIGSAGWESKFVTAALEEEGWRVDAEIRVAPSVAVTQGALAPIDTSRYSAVIALDGTAALRASDVSRYVSSGGGLVLAGSAGSLEAFSALRAGTTGNVQTPSVLETEPGSLTRKSLSVVPIAVIKPDAIRLESADGITTTAARRHNQGRVLQEGYLETWRWRMSGGDRSPSEHREWWTRAVASVAYAPVVRGAPVASDNAPIARLVDALGPASQAGTSPASNARSMSLWLLASALGLFLLAEWLSRRLRGAR
ncbi:MAG TPA: hypothetical protein VFD22_01250, partial [Gemmatimonadaceae bacterium]|nr:hypothetical protein [Gemmatimonadaceae bacterium]